MGKMVLSELWLYPVKSLAGFSVSQSLLEPFGLQHDRRWMVVSAESGEFVSQRSHPEMCLIMVELLASGIRMQHRDGAALSVNRPVGDVIQYVTVWGDRCRGWDAGDEAASWLTDHLQTDCRLVYFPEDEVRQVDLNYAQPGDKTAFSDGFPLLLISQASLDDLNHRLSEPVTMARFRPNLVISGCDAFAEDDWRRIRIGDTCLRVVKPCSRCAIPNVDPDTGLRGREPVQTLSQYRRSEGQVFFGQNVIADNPGRLEVGMPMEIIE